MLQLTDIPKKSMDPQYHLTYVLELTGFGVSQLGLAPDFAVRV